MDGEEKDGGRVGRGLGNVPFEFVGEVASAGAVAEARDVESGAASARHRVAYVRVSFVRRSITKPAVERNRRRWGGRW